MADTAPHTKPAYIVAEPGFSGHLLVFVKLLQDRAHAEQVPIKIVLSTQALTSVEFQTSGLVENDPEIIAADQHDVLPYAFALARRTKSRVAIPNADPFLLYIAKQRLSRDCPRVSALIMRDPRFEITSSPLVRRAKLAFKLLTAQALAASQGVRVFWLDLQGTDDSPLRRVAWDPAIIDVDDASMQGAALATEAAMDAHVHWVGIAGGISAHKRPHVVVDAVRIAATRCPGLGVALLGPIHADVSTVVDDALSRARSQGLPIRLLNRVMTNAEVNGAIAALDCLAMAYTTAAPNSTLVKASVLGTRIAAVGPLRILENVKTLGGYTSKYDDASGLAAAISEAVIHPGPADLAYPESDSLTGALLHLGK